MPLNDPQTTDVSGNRGRCCDVSKVFKITKGINFLPALKLAIYAGGMPTHGRSLEQTFDVSVVVVSEMRGSACLHWTMGRLHFRLVDDFVGRLE
jgi:hypothetical protein